MDKDVELESFMWSGKCEVEGWFEFVRDGEERERWVLNPYFLKPITAFPHGLCMA